jgi:hypothetical protein
MNNEKSKTIFEAGEVSTQMLTSKNLQPEISKPQLKEIIEVKAESMVTEEESSSPRKFEKKEEPEVKDSLEPPKA